MGTPFENIENCFISELTLKYSMQIKVCAWVHASPQSHYQQNTNIYLHHHTFNHTKCQLPVLWIMNLHEKRYSLTGNLHEYRIMDSIESMRIIRVFKCLLYILKKEINEGQVHFWIFIFLSFFSFFPPPSVWLKGESCLRNSSSA